MNIFLDIETLPTSDTVRMEALREGIRPPATHKKPETIAKWMSENAEAAYEEKFRATALDGTYGQIWAIGWATEDGHVECAIHSNEWTLLDTFASNIRRLFKIGRIPYFVGHNVSFDLQFLWRRAKILGVTLDFPLHHNATPWSGKYFDTMYAWAGKGKISLTELCRVLGIETGEDITGAEVYDCWLAGEQDKVAEHCRKDVERVRQVWERLK
jgi:hypothetical protein